MKSILSRSSLLLLLMGTIALVVAAQTPGPPSDPDPDFIEPARPTVSNPAEFQQTGVLQLEFGYSANFHAPGVTIAQDAPLALRFAVSRRWLVEFDGDNPLSQTADGARTTGAGDTQLGIQFVLHHEKASQPGVAVAYYVKLPTASSVKGLGTGRVDHNLELLVSKKFGKTTIDFNAICLVAGCTSSNGHAVSSQAALAVSRDLPRRFGLQGEISGFGRNDEQSGGLLLLGAVTYQVNRRFVLDCGMRSGLVPESARVGVFAGMTVGIADLYRRRHHGSGM